MQPIPVKRALLSVANKEGIVSLASALSAANVALISTGGTSEILTQAHIPHQLVESITGFASMLEGRVKTLHPKIHGGILAKRDLHHQEVLTHDLPYIDLVVVNFYPFSEGIAKGNITHEAAIELIDIGGPTMVRAAAKNHQWVGVVVDPSDYATVVDELKASSGLSLSTRLRLAEKAFAATCKYDQQIQSYMAKQLPSQGQPPTEILELHFTGGRALRYGENPHQQASVLRARDAHYSLLDATQHQGKALSYNNLLDADAALQCVHQFDTPACVIVKHNTPCGIATNPVLSQAYQNALACDPQSAYGGIVAINRPCTRELAEAVVGTFCEVILAPEFAADALHLFASKPNIRVLSLPPFKPQQWELRLITGALLAQKNEPRSIDRLEVVTRKAPTSAQLRALRFSWQVVSQVKSNAIVITNEESTLGISGGQVSRIDAVKMALVKAGERASGAVLASDAFFPFRDSIDYLKESGIAAIIQPGGSIRDNEVIAACDEDHIAMVFTHQRCFKH